MSLETCEEGHEQIVWVSSGNHAMCPVCRLIREFEEKVQELEGDVKKQQDKINTLEDEAFSLKEKLESSEAWAKERFSKTDDPSRVVPRSEA